MDAGFVDDLVVISRPNLPVFPVFFPVIRKFKFGDWFESDCILSQPIYLIAMEFFTSRFSERFRSEMAFRCPLHVRSYPNSGQTRARSVCPLCAISDHSLNNLKFPIHHIGIDQSARRVRESSWQSTDDSKVAVLPQAYRPLVARNDKVELHSCEAALARPL